MQGDLTSVDRVKSWLAPDQGQLITQNDSMIAGLISSISRTAMNVMGRDTLARLDRVETYAGGRTGMLVLRYWPVLSIASLTIGPGSTPLAPADYSLEAIRPGGGAQRVYLAGGRTFIAPPPAGVSIAYATGFVKSESFVVPAAPSPKIPVSSFWLQDEGVATPGGTPIAGYSVEAGVYTLPDDQAGNTIVISYSYAPADIEQVVIQESAMLMKSRAHIGEASKALAAGGGTLSYLPIKLSDLSLSMLTNYRRVVPS